MRHVQMTCLNHRNLRWSCKEIAVGHNGGYNQSRNIFFMGTVEQIANNECENMADECKCPSSDLRSVEWLEANEKTNG